MKQYTDTLVIDRSKWRSGHDSENKTGKGQTKLVNTQGYMCCLGFRCNQMGVPKNQLKGLSYPFELYEWELPGITNSDFGSQTDFTRKAISINDNPVLTRRERERAIREHFASDGIKVVFKGKYQ